MLRKVLLWAGFIIGIVIVSFPSLMIVERVREFRKDKPKKAAKQLPGGINHHLKESPKKPSPLVKEKITYPRNTDRGVVFQYKPAQRSGGLDTAQKVFVAGTFNNWDGRKGMMSKNADDIWEVTIPVKPGKYTYKFKQAGVWFLDSENPASADDGKGGRVSVLIVK